MINTATGNTQPPKQRIYVYDNAKFFLIFTVLLGHLVESFCDDSAVMRSTFLFIYMFHMPLFIFLSGLFQKKYSDKVRLNTNRVISYILLGIVLKMAGSLYRYPEAGKLEFSLFYEGRIPWFLFALAAYIVAMYLLRNFKPAAVIIISIAVACFAGYDSNIDDLLALSRIIVFFPFYALGYYLEPETVAKFLKKKWVKIIAVVILVLAVYICLTRIDRIYDLRPSFTGMRGYNDWVLGHGGALVRLLCYAASTALGLSILAVIPDINAGYITRCGTKTLQVYFWHMVILAIGEYAGVWQFLFSFGIPGKLSFIAICFLLVLLLSTKLFSWPVEYITKKSYTKSDRT